MNSSYHLDAVFNRGHADSETLTVPAVLSTETPVKRAGFVEILKHHDKSVDLSRFPLPLIESHNDRQVNIGVVENPRINGGKLRGNVRFGRSQRAMELFEDVKNGIIRGLSIGYEWLDYQETHDSEANKIVNVTRFQPYEVSIVAIPADTEAGFYRGKPMLPNEEDTTEQNEEIDLNDKKVQRAMRLERERVTRIREIANRFAIDAVTTGDFLESGASVADFQTRVREIQRANLKPVPSAPRMTANEMGGFGGQYVRDAMVDGILLRHGVKVKEPHAAARDFASMSIHEMARMLLREHNDYQPAASAAALMKRALSTTDLTIVLENAANKSLIMGFDEAPQTHDTFCSFVEVKDFKTNSRIALSAVETLAAVVELGTVTYSDLSDSKETYAIASYQKAISFSRQALINDDLAALTNIPEKFGAAARRTEADLVYNIFNTNPTMSDTVALFDATRGNLLTGASSALDAASLASAVVGLRKAKDIGNIGYLGVRPRWLIVPPELEITALQLIATLTNTQASATAVPGSDFARIEVIVEPRLSSATAWFMLGQGVETIEVGRLAQSGGAGISFESEKDFDTDAFKMKVRLDAGAKALSPLAMVKATGTV